MIWPARRRPPPVDAVHQAVLLDRAERIAEQLVVASKEMQVALKLLREDESRGR